MQRLMTELFPLCRSILSPATTATLERIAGEVPIEIRSVPSGTKVLDWEVPDEWDIRDAYITVESSDERLVDFRQSNLHVVSHSVPVDRVMSLDELLPHLHSLPDRPTLVPYRTSYYAANWGFCVTDDVRRALQPGQYHVVIDSTLQPGHLRWGELVVPGIESSEVLLTTHICHPSMANDNLSGIAVLVELARLLLAGGPRRYTHRLLFLPGTIGSIAWLAQAGTIERITHGLVLTGLGDDSPLTYKRSRRGDAAIDRIAAHVVAERSGRVVNFSPYGYDERQFCSPGFDLPVGRLSRGVHGQYPEYHTSADNLSFVSADRLAESLAVLAEMLDAVEANVAYRSTAPYGEPQLGRRGLYSSTGGGITDRSVEMAYLWVLSGADGHHDLCDIAADSGLPFSAVLAAASRLHAIGLLEH